MKNTYHHFDVYAPRVFIGMAILYFLIQVVQTYFQKIECDEFWFAYHIGQYLHKLPYRDFLPYKSVVGYYLYSLPFLISNHAFNTLWLVKLQTALLNAAGLSITGFWLSKYVRPSIVLCSLSLVVFNESFLVYSSSLRPEMIMIWLGLFSFLFILENKIVLAGLTAGLAFLLSQKAAWYLIACNMAMVSTLFFPGYFYKTIRQLVIYNGLIVLMVAIYLLLWSLVTSWQTLFYSFFYETLLIGNIDYYKSVRYAAWQVILAKVGFLFLLWPLIGLSLLTVPLKKVMRRLQIVVYSAVLMTFIFLYPQPFSYNAFFAFPAFFVVYPTLFSWLFYEVKTEISYFNKRALFYFIAFYSLVLMAVMISFSIPIVVFLVIITLTIGGYLYCLKQENVLYEKIFTKLIWVGIIVSGVIYAWLAYFFTLPLLVNSYQKNNLLLAQTLLEKNEGYLAGTPFLYAREQPIDGMKNLISPAVKYLHHPSDKLAPLLNASLNMTPTTSQAIIQQMKNEPIKLYIDNYRLHLMPESIKDYLNSHFRHYSGSIFLYAPIIPSGTHTVSISFSGQYLIKCDERLNRRCDEEEVVFLDNQPYSLENVVILESGEHLSKASKNYSLYWIPAERKHPSIENDFTEMTKNVYM